MIDEAYLFLCIIAMIVAMAISIHKIASLEIRLKLCKIRLELAEEELEERSKYV